MAFQQNNLSVVAYANGFTHWHYITTDAPAEVIAPGYFNGASDLMRRGDMLLVNAGYNPDPVNFMLGVTGNSTGVPVVGPLWSPPAVKSESISTGCAVADGGTNASTARIVPYTDDDERIDPDMAGMVMIYVGRDGEIPDHILDRIPEAAAKVICGLLNAAKTEG